MLFPPTPLTAAEIVTLEACSSHGPHPRQRRRALAILGHHRGQSLPPLAALFAVRYATRSTTGRRLGCNAAWPAWPKATAPAGRQN